MKDVLLTPEGYEKLKQEIEYLRGDKRREIADRIRIAREFGDIAENAEYDDAKNDQAMLEHKIAQLEERLLNARVIDTGEVALGGRVPVNVSGGLLSKGHPLGATGIANIYEVCTHLRGEAGKRQVQGARFGMTHVIGLGSACAIHILEKAN